MLTYRLEAVVDRHREAADHTHHRGRGAVTGHSKDQWVPYMEGSDCLGLLSNQR